MWSWWKYYWVGAKLSGKHNQEAACLWKLKDALSIFSERFGFGWERENKYLAERRIINHKTIGLGSPTCIETFPEKINNSMKKR